MNFDVKLVSGGYDGESPMELIKRAEKQIDDLMVTVHKLADMKILLQETETRQLK